MINIQTFKTIDELINYKFYDTIIWLNIESITFNQIFIFPKNLENIYLYKCLNCNHYLSCLPNTIKNINITECFFNNYQILFNKNQINLETCNLSYNRITTIYNVFPDNLISLDLSYNDINKYPDTNYFSNKLQILNLSDNQLNDLPNSILSLDINCNTTLMPNKFWFNSYTGISLNKKIDNYYLDIAERFFSNSLRLKLYNIKHITENNLPLLRENIVPKPKQLNKVTAEQKQNVHNSDIQNSFNISVKAIINYEAPIIINIYNNIINYYNNNNNNIILQYFCVFSQSNQFIDEINKRFNINDIISSSGITYKELFYKIWCISEIHIHKHEIRKIIKEEVISGIGYCFTGCITRLVNSLSGFIDGIQIGYSENEQINNTVIMIMRKCEANNSLIAYDEIKKALDELNIDENKQKIWLDAL
jgi:hypothetical protein